MKVILDCNIWISFLIGHQTELMRRILTDLRFDVYVCDELMNEINEVSSRPKIRSRITDSEMDDFCRIIFAFCKVADIEHVVDSNIRDPKDLYMLSLAESIDADYLVSGDADLLDLEQHHKTKMIKLSEFKSLIQK